MALSNNSTALKNVRQRNYLARDFDGFRQVILDYARRYYPDRIADFSESSMGGVLLDMAAYVGDNMSFYLDHQYNELFSDTVVETQNVERTIRNAGIKIEGSSPSVATEDFYVEVPVLNDGKLTPDPTLLPTLKAGGILRADNGTEFVMLEDVQFWQIDPDTGDVTVPLDVTVTNGRRSLGTIITKILKKSGLLASGKQTTETFDIGEFVAFRSLVLAQPNITQVISVVDGLGNTYYEVDNLTHDVVYKNVLNTAADNSLVKDSLKVIPAPYRFMRNVSLSDRSTTLVFGGGTADSLEDDVIPDPSEFAISFPYSRTFSRIPINPQKLLQTATLGVASANTTLTVTYRYGGGLSHNVEPNNIRNVVSITAEFPENPSAASQQQVKNSLETSNADRAAGGEDPMTADEMLALVPAVKNSQERIVTKEDMLARVYSMPSNFGRVFRAAVSKNPNNPLASQLFIVSRNSDGQLIPSPDALKINLKRYLSSYRMISDAVDVLDAAVIDLELFFQIVADPSLNKTILLQNIIKDLKAQFDVKKFNINQPIVISDVVSTIFSQPGVIAVDSIKFNNLRGTIKNREYSPMVFDVFLNTKNQIIYPPTGGIFEVKYPDVNLVGRCISNV